ncbi:hypothetical protein DES53_103347 [Roseimicrobium gellanilyticum]|uniref:Uncharacterized protein n=1 Tax=Roseimicrobium gellanilyticum TaxID=748857 RepID=A0A366HR79_9BACT|nr:hypothetical protein [Roseimicrobium gellanilyticum]RBP45349.1 hypothetical protein DES53_103347 [Roseimicrobium gellanilyticum]
MPHRYLVCLTSVFLLGISSSIAEDSTAKKDERYPFRTDFANAHLLWYQPKKLEFPPHHSDRRISGELVSVDYILRKGQFRATKTGELVSFTMPPYAYVSYLNAEVDLREVPLGTFFLFFLNQDEDGGFTKLATMQEQFTMDASHSFTYKLDEAKLAEGKLLTTKHSIKKNQPDLGKKELLVTKETRVWKGEQQVKLEDLKPGDELLYNLTGKTADKPGWCTDIWVGEETHQLATETQRKKYTDFIKTRGVAGWVEKTEGKSVTVTLFSGDAKSFKETFGADFVVGKTGKMCVANEELRTWNPPVDGESANMVTVDKAPESGYGCSGVRVTVTVSNMLEGFRKGRVVRLFAQGWKAQDQFYGESLMGYGFGRMQNQELVENVAKEYPEQFPFRTDYSNRDLPWYKLQPNVKPPPFSEHVITGELLKTDAAARTGQFRKDGTGELVDFNLTPEGGVQYVNADASLADIPLGTRCRFSLYQDEKGAFTKASLVTDEYTRFARNVTTMRVVDIKQNGEVLFVAHQIPEVKDYNGDMKRPPDIARGTLRLDSQTRLWKGDREVKISDVAVGDVLLANFTGEQAGAPARCTEIWIGEDTHKQVSEGQKKKNAERLKAEKVAAAKK